MCRDDREEVAVAVVLESIDTSIAELVARLTRASDQEAARIHARIAELRELRKQYTT